MVRQLGDNVYFEKMSLRQTRLDITGIAESNNRISTQLRNFTAPNGSMGPMFRRLMRTQQLAPKLAGSP